MKSLWKISRRYIWSAILLTVVILYANFAAFLYFGTRNISNMEGNEVGRERMEEIVCQLDVKDGVYELSEKGYELLSESSFSWAMLLDEYGNPVFGWQLPGELWRHYSIADVAAFSRWYLDDYPVRVWKRGEGLMVFGMEKGSAVKFSVLYDMDMLFGFIDAIKGSIIMNLLLLIVLPLFFGYRFYRSIQPLAGGIERLAAKQVTDIPVKGVMGDLAKKLNQASAILKEQDDRLKQRDRARTDWIAGVSHDIRTPLALMAGYADELAREPAIGEEGRKRAEQIQSLSLTIGQLISDLNMTSKLEYQAQPLRRTEVSPAKLLRECVAEYYNQGIPDGYEIEVVIDPKTEKMKLGADEGLLLRAFRNLIGNSIRHNPGGCTVAVQLEAKAEGAQYFFSDTGTGIPENVVHVLQSEKRDAVWESAGGYDDTNVEDSHTIHVMGLRIVMQIVKAHGWRMEFVKRESGTYDVRISISLHYT